MQSEKRDSALYGGSGLSKNTAVSIRRRLLNLAKEKQENFDYVLRQYLMQRLLYRLSISDHKNQFLLKGAMLFWVWNPDTHRPTRDIDLLGFGNNDKEHLAGIFHCIIAFQEDDGLVFDKDSLHIADIKENEKYQGVRITGHATLEAARIPFQIDVGFGDAVTPDAETIEVHSFLDLPNASIGAYPVYTVIAEKFQAMVELGIVNSRLKDFYDLLIISRQFDLDGHILAEAIAATFERRGTAIDMNSLTLFSDSFKNDKQKAIQWNAFLMKNGLSQKESFSEIVASIESFLFPLYQCLSDRQSFSLSWSCKSMSWK